jgi:ABC-type phosphate/phosphonate transport system substrate-binding protein
MRHELARRGCAVTAALEFERKPVPGRIERETLFTQVCGYPLQTIYRGEAALLGAPVYAVDHCDGPRHAGVFIARRNSAFGTLADLRGCRFLFNSVHSNSGMNLPRRAIAGIAQGVPFFASIAATDSQPGNIERVARGEADATCVECVTYAFVCRHRPRLGLLTRVLAATPPSPSIPFVTSSATTADLRERLQAALLAVARDPVWMDVRAGLMLRDIVPVEWETYAVQMRYAREAAELGYPKLQ